jgi:fructan beta-fructosidase
MDYGKDHYATVSWSNAPEGRHTVIAWMSNWQYANAVPTKQFRSANSLPRDIELFKGDDGEYYICTTPSPELVALRGKEKEIRRLRHQQ